MVEFLIKGFIDVKEIEKREIMNWLLASNSFNGNIIYCILILLNNTKIKVIKNYIFNNK